eukprot:CAMPEP_0117419950 /NCGR_PEP_ID=MMETSP0758-20121206/1408_1 /TAXON_ID=63605 /ORGANISM="Percolomonas cosmopolitus, Strain AE-1 (ATCC 50343)" /LENGTH=1166 /DNA_ID=CAMNT_0005201319 /DNA_START=15 /DNA_END=3511 /DNA_ORIENTATION=-
MNSQALYSNYVSSDLFSFIKEISVTETKEAEDKILAEEVEQKLKNKLTEGPLIDVPLHSLTEDFVTEISILKEFLVKVMYLELMGFSGEWGYNEAIKLTASDLLPLKQLGYLFCCLYLGTENDLSVMTIGNIQKDLTSTNYMVVNMACKACLHLIDENTFPAILPTIEKLLKHESPHVRKKAVMVLLKGYRLNEELVPNMMTIIQNALCDSDVSVMAATLCLLYEVLKNQVASEEGLQINTEKFVPVLVSILKSIAENRIASGYVYHRLPGPWIQIHLLRILAILGHSNRDASQGMYEILRTVMNRADVDNNMGPAVMFEAMRTVAHIYPNRVLLEHVAKHISAFMMSPKPNIKYAGIRTLLSLIQLNPKYAGQYQQSIILALESQDEPIKRVALDIIYLMATPKNVKFVISKLMDVLSRTLDVLLREEITQKIFSLAENLSPNVYWYIKVINGIFEMPKAIIKSPNIQSVLSIIAESEVETDEDENDFKRSCVDLYFQKVDEDDNLPELYVQLITWVLGEYGYLSENYEDAQIIDLMIDLSERSYSDTQTRSVILSSLLKCCTRTDVFKEEVLVIFKTYCHSHHVDLQQRAYECLRLYIISKQLPNDFLTSVLPLDGSCCDIRVDKRLSFLNGFVKSSNSETYDESQNISIRTSDDRILDVRPLLLEQRESLQKPMSSPASSDASKQNRYLIEDSEMEEKLIIQNSSERWNASYEDEDVDDYDTKRLNPDFSPSKPRGYVKKATTQFGNLDGTQVTTSNPFIQYEEGDSMSSLSTMSDTSSNGSFSHKPKSKHAKRVKEKYSGMFSGFDDDDVTSSMFTKKSSPPLVTKKPPRVTNSWQDESDEEMLAPTPSPPPPSEPPKPAVKNLIDFDDLFSSDTKAPPPPTQNDVLSMFDSNNDESQEMIMMPMSDASGKMVRTRNAFTEKLLKSNKVSDNDMDVASKNDHLLLQYICVPQKKSILYIFLFNALKDSLSDVVLTIDPQPFIEVKGLKGDPSHIRGLTTSKSIHIAQLTNQEVAVSFQIALLKPELMTTTFWGNVTYNVLSKNQSHSVKSSSMVFTINCPFLRFFIPNVIPVSEFAKQWKRHAANERTMSKSGIQSTSITRLASNMETLLNAHVIQVINQEVILSVTMLNLSTSAFIHLKLTGKDIQLKMRSEANWLIDHLL